MMFECQFLIFLVGLLNEVMKCQSECSCSCLCGSGGFWHMLLFVFQTCFHWLMVNYHPLLYYRQKGIFFFTGPFWLSISV